MEGMQECRPVRKHAIYYNSSTHLLHQKQERFSVTGLKKNNSAQRGQRLGKESRSTRVHTGYVFFSQSHLIRMSERKTQLLCLHWNKILSCSIFSDKTVCFVWTGMAILNIGTALNNETLV